MIKKRKFLIFLLVVLFGFLSNPVCQAFDRQPAPFKEFINEKYVDLSTSIPFVTTIGTAIGYYVDDSGKVVKAEGNYTIRGVGFVVKPGYVLTAAHIVVPKRVTVQETESFYWRTKIIHIKTRSIYIGDMDGGAVTGYIYYIDEDEDVALLRYYNSPSLKPLPYKIAWSWEDLPFYGPSSLVSKGTAVAVITRQRDEAGEFGPWFEVRTGTVRSDTPTLPDIFEKYLPAFSMNQFAMDLVIIPGDSGSPVFAFLNGEPVIIGMANMYCPPCEGYTGEIYTFATRIDFIRTILESK